MLRHLPSSIPGLRPTVFMSPDPDSGVPAPAAAAAPAAAPAASDPADDPAATRALAGTIPELHDSIRVEFTTRMGNAEENAAALRRDFDAMLAERRSNAGLAGYDPNRKGDPNDPESFSLARAMIGQITGWDDYSRNFPEYDPIHAYNSDRSATPGQRSQNAGFGDTGGIFIPLTMMPTVIEALEAQSIALAMGAQNLVGLPFGPTMWPKEEGGATAFRVGEEKTITESEEEYGEFMLQPRQLSAIIRESRTLLKATGSSFQSRLEKRLATKLQLRMDRDFFIGANDQSEPNGIFNAAGFLTEDFSSADYLGVDQNVSLLLDSMIQKMKAALGYIGYGPIGFVGPSKAYQKLRTVKDLNGAPILYDARNSQVDNAGVGASTLWGHRFGESEQLSSDNPIDFALVAFGATMMALYDDIEFMVSEHANGAFAKNQVLIRAVAYNDSGIWRGEHICKATGFDPAG